MIRGKRYPTADNLRHALRERVRDFGKLTGTSQSTVGIEAVGDKSAVSRIAEGSNFKIATYQRLMNWLDANWPRRRLPRRKSDRHEQPEPTAVDPGM